MKIAIITFSRALNYGAVLQSYALQQTISDFLQDNSECFLLDYKCSKIENSYKYFVTNNIKSIFTVIKRIINLPFRIIILSKKKGRYNKFIKENLKLFALYNNDFNTANDYFDIFITGSDQVWNNNLTGADDSYFLKFVKDTRKKFSYAASFGKEENFLKYQNLILENLSDFDVISLREPICEDILMAEGYKLRTDIDPTLLLDRFKWENLIKHSKIQSKEYILLYCVAVPKDLILQAKELSKETGLQVLCLTDSVLDKLRYPFLSVKMGNGPIEFLSLIKNAKYVLTTSFHGTAFSIIFHKNFYVELNNRDGFNYRVNNILTTLDLMECSDYSRFRNKNFVSAEKWNEVDKRLDSVRNESIEYLKSITLNYKDMGEKVD